MSDLSGYFVPQFPATFLDGAGITADVEGLNVRLRLDFEQVLDTDIAPVGGTMLVQDAAGELYRVALSQVGVFEVPTDTVIANLSGSTGSATAVSIEDLATALGGTSVSIPDGSVTNAKLADMPTLTVKGRAAAGDGPPQNLTAADAKSLLAIAIADVLGLQTELDGLQPSLGFTPENAANKGASNGYAPLAAGKVPSEFLPADGSYLGAYNASTNTPAITNGSHNPGDFLIVSVAGTVAADSVGAVGVGDQIRRGVTAWERIPAASAVASVAGKTGAVVLEAADISNSTATGRSLMTGDQAAGRTALALGALATMATVGTGQIADDAVTNAKLANMATMTLKGNDTAGTGNPVDLTVAAVKAMLAYVKADVGLASVDNTADTAKPISTATQAALDTKAPKISPLFTDRITVPAVAHTVDAKGSIASGTATFDATQFSVFTLTVAGAQTWAFTWGAGYSGVKIMATNAGAFAITFPTVNWLKGDGTYTTTFADQGVTLQATGVNHFLLWTNNGGTTVYGRAG